MQQNENESKKQLKDFFLEVANDPIKRKIVCEDNIALFSLIYFTKFHFFKMPDFHKLMYDDLLFKNMDGIIWEMFRESAKTSLAKIALVHSICYEKDHFPIWVSFDEKKAASNLFDVAVELQTNEKIIEDFGQLFYDNDIEEKVKKRSKKKSIREFITANNIKVKAYSTGMSIRGEVYGEYRPDKIVLDDIETMKTAVSEARTEQVKAFIDEMLSGTSGYAKILVLANRVTDNGSVAYLKERIKDDPRWILRDVPVVYPGNILAWPSKYVFTDVEADTINLTIKDKKKHVISLETKKRRLGQTVYNREMMNQPLSDEEREIKIEWLQHTFVEDEIKNLVRNRYILMDVADSKARHKSNPDYTATVVVDVDGQGVAYVIYARQDRYNGPELIDWIFYLQETYKPLKFGIEKKSLEDQIIPYIKQRSEEVKIFPVVVELKHGGTRKEDRIRGSLQGPLSAGRIKFRKDARDHTDILKAQLFDFPRSVKDDLSDCLAYYKQIAAKPFYGQDTAIMPQLHKEFYAYRKMQKKKQSAVSKIRSL